MPPLSKFSIIIVANPSFKWIITPHGEGQAIIPLPRDGSDRVRYLTPSSINVRRPVTLSPFPAAWQILPSSDYPAAGGGAALVGTSVPKGLYDEWTCQIYWPHFKKDEQPKMLDLWEGAATPNNNVRHLLSSHSDIIY